MTKSTTGWVVHVSVAGFVLAVVFGGHAAAAPVTTPLLCADWQSDPSRYEATKDDPELKKLPLQLMAKYGLPVVLVAIVAGILSRKR
jgi:hypothetical protein